MGDVGSVSVYGVIVLDNLTGVILIQSMMLKSVDWCTGVMKSWRNDEIIFELSFDRKIY